MPDPIDPLSALASAAAEHHEIFLAWKGAGFSEEQALELLKALIVANAQNG